MKNTLFILFTFFACTIGLSQEAGGGKLKKAKLDYQKFSYNNAIGKYEATDLSTIEAKRNLAISYWRSNELKKADSIYALIVTMEKASGEDVYNYAQVLRQNKKYEQSDEWMLKFAELNGADSRGAEYNENKGNHVELLKDKEQFIVKNLEINTELQDFGAAVYFDKVVFASSREKSNFVFRRWNWNQLPFLDVYIADRGSNAELYNAQLYNKKINKKYHEGPVAFNSDGSKMIYTRNNYTEKASDKKVRLKMYISNKDSVTGEWSKPEPLPFNSPEYSVGHPSISQDGKWLYFVSDMSGGFGGVDVYKSAISENGSFGAPINLGSEINTEGNEMFPFIHPTNEMLFYSSDGRYGLGGLDVFVAQLNEDGSIGKTLNVGAPINSNRDDFSFSVNAGQNSGYFSSNREGGKGDDDIYSFEMLKPFAFGKRMFGSFVDANGEIIEGFSFKILDLDNNIVLEGLTDSELPFILDLVENQKYTLTGYKEGYYTVNAEIDGTESEDDDFEIKFTATEDPGISLYTYIYDGKTNQAISGAEIFLTDNLTGEIKKFNTSEKGDHLYPLMEKQIGDSGAYSMTINKPGYLTVSGSFELLFDKKGQYSVDEYLEIKMEAIEVGGDLSKIIDINPIYFDLNKYFIRPDAAIELDKIVKVMNDNPTMVVELGSHTDSRGSEASNRTLSDRRAKASAAYIAERITNPERISGKGYGESTPNTIDASVDGGSENQILTEPFINSFKSSNKALFDKYHQYNRRTEFIIIQM